MTEGICPSGWHIPSDGELTQLTDFLGGSGVAGGKMKETGYDHWYSPNTVVSNSIGFTGLPGGSRLYGDFNNINSSGFFWSSSTSGGSSAVHRYLVSGASYLDTNDSDQYFGFSARCVRD
jgi:uncharacterized protein (TIGR02145 family)